MIISFINVKKKNIAKPTGAVLKLSPTPDN